MLTLVPKIFRGGEDRRKGTYKNPFAMGNIRHLLACRRDVPSVKFFTGGIGVKGGK